jgi:hypothetical protein
MAKRYKIIFLVLIFAVLLCGAFVFYKYQTPQANYYYTVAVLPDIQNYSSKYPEILKAQTQWIAENIKKENIVFAVQEGDIVNNFDNKTQWQNAKSAFDLIIGKLPVGMLLGNHDISANMESSNFNEYFFNYKRNNYQLFSMGNAKFIGIELSFCPTESDLDWANKILQQNTNRKAILTTHGYLDTTSKRNVSLSKNPFGGCVGQNNNTQYIWDNLITKNNNIFLVLSGHMHGTAQRTDKNNFSQPVFQLLADYQTEANGGNGWMRLLEFNLQKKQIHVKTYSPYLNKYMLDTNNDFVLNY